MSERARYPAGVPCWVETLQPDPSAALAFYGPLFEWEFAGAATMPGRHPGRYFVARVRGLDVAGIGLAAETGDRPDPAWITHVRVDGVDEVLERARRAGGIIRAGPLDARPAGRLAMLTDPAGALFGVWEAGSREGAGLVNEPRAWALSSLRTTDPASSTAFYGTMFGWQAERFGAADAGLTMWRLPGYFGGLPTQPVPRDVVGIMAPLDGGAAADQPHWRVDFFVEDAEATVVRAVSLGGTVIRALQDTPGFRNALLADPRGAVFSVTQPKPAPAS